MAKVWKKWDLGGGGLQSANIALLRYRKRPGPAYALWLLFPLGAHALYLNAYARAAIYMVATVIAAIVAWSGYPIAGLALIGCVALFALYDLVWIDRRITELNKALRIAVSLQAGGGAPRTFTGRYQDPDLDTYLKEKEQERAGHTPLTPPVRATGRSRSASFAEQEAQLRALTGKGSSKTRKE